MTIQPLLPAPNLTRCSNHSTHSVHSIQMTWKSTWTHPPLLHLRCRLLLRLCLSHLHGALCLLPRLIPPPFPRHMPRHTPCLLSLKQNTISPAPTQPILISMPSPHLYRFPESSPKRRAASQVHHTVVSLLHPYTAQVPSRLPTLHPVYALGRLS